MTWLDHILKKNPRLAIGLISGTSMDGVDAAMVSIRNHGEKTQLELQGFLTHPYPDGMQDMLTKCSTAGSGSIDETCRLNFLLGEFFAEAVFQLLKQTGVKATEVDFIGSHGQTLHHLPAPKEMFGYEIVSTLQLAEPSVIAKRTGIVTVADFRSADMGVGGQGAPLVPYFDFIAFRSADKNRILLNIGGIANVTVLNKAGSVADVRAFDTGPGNMVIDYLAHTFFSMPYDAAGEIGRSGEISQELLDIELQHPFFKKAPPKSTGREEFGQAFSERFIDRAQDLGVKPEGIVGTATELTAVSIAKAINNYLQQMDEIIISGGGAHNRFLMERLAEHVAPINVISLHEMGIPVDAKEAVCFAVLANETLFGQPGNVPSATGAREATILGKICL